MSLTQFKLETDLVEAVTKIYAEKFPELSVKNPTEAIRQTLRDFVKQNKVEATA